MESEIASMALVVPSGRFFVSGSTSATSAGASRDSSAGSRRRAGRPPATTPPTGPRSTRSSRSSRSGPSGATSDGRAATARAARPSSVAAGRVMQPASAALEVEHRVPIDEHDVRAGRALQRQPLVALGRGQASAAPYGCAGSVAARTRTVAFVVADRPQPVDRAGQRELRRPEAGDEVAAPRSARLLHGAQHRVDRCVAAGDPLGRHALAGDDSVALEQRGRRGRGRARSAFAPRPTRSATSDQRPAARGGPSATSRPGRGAPSIACAAARGRAAPRTCRSSPRPPRRGPTARRAARRRCVPRPIAARSCGKNDAPRRWRCWRMASWIGSDGRSSDAPALASRSTRSRR